jgi:hypothetical protein
MKHAWMHICQAGCVIGSNCLQDLEAVIWQEGEMMSINPTMPANQGHQQQ